MSLHEMIDKTLGFVFLHKNFKTLGSSRTDAKVSANTYFFQLFTNETIVAKAFIKRFNSQCTFRFKSTYLNQYFNPF